MQINDYQCGEIKRSVILVSYWAYNVFEKSAQKMQCGKNEPPPQIVFLYLLIYLSYCGIIFISSTCLT